MTTQDHALMMFLAHEALDHAWQEEWQALNDTNKDKVARDFLAAEITAGEYVGRILRGNLASYTKCL